MQTLMASFTEPKPAAVLGLLAKLQSLACRNQRPTLWSRYHSWHLPTHWKEHSFVAASFSLPFLFHLIFSCETGTGRQVLPPIFMPGLDECLEEKPTSGPLQGVPARRTLCAGPPSSRTCGLSHRENLKVDIFSEGREQKLPGVLESASACS